MNSNVENRLTSNSEIFERRPLATGIRKKVAFATSDNTLAPDEDNHYGDIQKDCSLLREELVDVCDDCVFYVGLLVKECLMECFIAGSDIHSCTEGNISNVKKKKESPRHGNASHTAKNATEIKHYSDKRVSRL